MLSIHTFIGVFFILYALIAILKGKFTLSDGDTYNGGVTSNWITRSERPVLFWLLVALFLALAAAFILNVFNLPF